jgi:hypothetical protein
LIVSSATVGLAANVLYFVPFRLPGLPVNRVQAETTTGAGNARFGIYSNLNGNPDTLLCETAGAVDVSGVAVFTTAIPDIVLPEWCWGAMVCSGTPTVRGGSLGNSATLGTDNLGAARRGLTMSHNFGALPAQTSSLSWSNVAPMLCLGRA